MAAAELARIRARISGRVQGVSFRYYTQRQAEALVLTGWVRNRTDSTVELIAEGPRQSLEQLVEWCRQGPALARVDQVALEWEEYTGEFERFSIRPTGQDWA
jgi:acylphosphatase